MAAEIAEKKINPASDPLRGGRNVMGKVFYTEISLTSAEILALRATPKVLVAAPGAGRVIEFVSAAVILKATATAYVESAANLVVRYGTTTGAIVSQVGEMTGFIDQTADMSTVLLPKVDPIATAVASTNVALVLHNNGAAEYTTGTGTMRVKVAYKVHATA